jgi:hypothetical protein
MSIDCGRQTHLKVSRNTANRHHPYGGGSSDVLKSGVSRSSTKKKTAATNRLSTENHNMIMAACKRVNDAAVLHLLAKVSTAQLADCAFVVSLAGKDEAATLAAYKAYEASESQGEGGGTTDTGQLLIVRGRGDGTGCLGIYRVLHCAPQHALTLRWALPDQPAMSLEKLKGATVFWIKAQFPFAVEKSLLSIEAAKKPNRDHAILAADYESLTRKIRELDRAHELRTLL